MDLLQGYSASEGEEEEEEKLHKPPASSTAASTITTSNIQPTTVLPPPVWDDDASPSTTQPQALQGSGDRKRPIHQVSGFTLLSGGGPMKVSGKSTGTTNTPGTGGITKLPPPNLGGGDGRVGMAVIPAALIPPQARGRANISTEEMDLAAERQRRLKAAARAKSKMEVE